jgi:MFS family permease
VWLSIGLAAVTLALFFWHLRRAEKSGKEPLLHLRLFRNRTANLALGTQTIQWLIMQGTFFVTAVFLQEVRGYTAIQTGLVLTPATVGILASSAGAARFARRHEQRSVVIAGFVITLVGIALHLALVREESGILRTIPGLLLIGFGLGAMLTSSVTIVQSSFPDNDQADISGLSRSVSNLGSSLGTALVGSILVAAAIPGGRPYAASLAIMMAIALIGLVLAVCIRRPLSS